MCVCTVPALMEYGGLRRLLHLSELVATMMVYCMPQTAPLSTQEVPVLLHPRKLRSCPSAVTTKKDELD